MNIHYYKFPLRSVLQALLLWLDGSLRLYRLGYSQECDFEHFVDQPHRFQMMVMNQLRGESEDSRVNIGESERICEGGGFVFKCHLVSPRVGGRDFAQGRVVSLS